MTSKKRVGFYTLGCKLNFSETSTIAREFEEGGFERAAKGEQPDIYVINSCSVTDHADKKCRNIIRKIIKENPDAIIAVTGCYAQLKPEEIAAIEGVDLVIGNNDKGSIFEKVTSLRDRAANQSYATNDTALGAANTTNATMLDAENATMLGAENAAVLDAAHNRTSRRAIIHTCEASELTSFFSSFSSGDRTRTFLKVQDGCDYHCSYCTIPMARGASRNISISELTEQAKQVAAKGQREIVITGINTGDFGKTTSETFIDLLKSLEQVEGIDRYRISSIEPNLITDQIIEFVSQSRNFQPHFHIPLQSGCDRILALMRRRYNTQKFAERISSIRNFMPDAFIGIDVIVGFPGETAEDFEQTRSFLEKLSPSFIHIFPYSVRPNTPAAEFADRVHPLESARRVKVLTELSERLHKEFYSRFIGTTAEVLWESTRHAGEIHGYTSNYIKVKTAYDKNLINRITNVKLKSIELDNFSYICSSEVLSE